MRACSPSARRWPGKGALAALAACAAITGGAYAADAAALATPTDLGTDGAHAATHGNPLVILFSLPECCYCAVVRRNDLAPLTRMPRAADRLVVRELELTGTTPLAGFHGEQVRPSELAARYGVKVAPTVVLLDRDGRLLAAPLAGGDVAGMYGAYLDRALDEARASLAQPNAVRATDPKK